MAESAGDKKFEATAHRRQQAREQGNVVKSHDLVSSAVLLVGLLILLWLGEMGATQLGVTTKNALTTKAQIQASELLVQQEWNRYATIFLLVCGPLLAVAFVVTLVSNLFQTGILFLPDKVGLDIKRINPMSGFSRIFSLQNVVRLFFGLMKIGLVMGVAGVALWNEQSTILKVAELNLDQVVRYFFEITVWTCIKMASVLFILAIFDYFFQSWKYGQDLRMTEEEMKEEIKNTLGDPHVIAKRKAIQRQLVMNRMNTSVPSADMVITNPTELAIAIQYDINTMVAPIVVAKGAGVLAQRIRRLALENNIPIIERKELAQALYKEVDINHPIPQGHYGAVAELLRYVYDLKGKPMPKQKKAA